MSNIQPAKHKISRSRLGFLSLLIVSGSFAYCLQLYLIYVSLR